MSIEIIEVVFVWGIPLLVIYLLYQSEKELVHMTFIFKRLARDNQGTLHRRTWFEYPSLTVNDQGFAFSLGISLASGGKVWTTRLNMAHRQAIDFKLRLQPHNRLEKMSRTVGFQDAPIGGPQFNDHFLVKTGNEARARQFMNEDLQQALLRLRYLNPELAVAKSAIVLTTSFTDRAGDFQELVNFGRLLCRRLGRYPWPELPLKGTHPGGSLAGGLRSLGESQQ